MTDMKTDQNAKRPPGSIVRLWTPVDGKGAEAVTVDGVDYVEMHPSGAWLILTMAESGQVIMARIDPDVTSISIDRSGGIDLE